MDTSKYQDLVWRGYMGKKLHTGDQLINNALGLVGEAGEVADQVKKELYLGANITRDEVVEELGDVMWHLCCMASVRGITLEEIMEYNIKKLKERYPDAGW